MTEWENRRLERVIGGDVCGETHAQASRRYETSRSLIAKLASQGMQPTSAIAVKTWRDDDAWVVVLAGELDLAGSEKLRAALRRAIGEPRPRLIVDLSGLSFIDSSGVNAILDAYRQWRSAGPALTIRPGPPNVQQVFKLTNTLNYLPFESLRTTRLVTWRTRADRSCCTSSMQCHQTPRSE